MKTKLNFNSKFIATMLFTMAMLWLPQICSRVMAQEAYAVFDATTGTLTFKYDNNKPAGAYEMNKGEIDPGWYKHGSYVKCVVFEPSFAQARPTSCYAWFSSFEDLTSITGLQYLNTEKVETMKYMFNGCENLTSLDLSTFNTQNVKDMDDMFDYCINLTSLNLDNFNTQNVENMYQMFVNCQKIQKLNLYSFDTSKVKSMDYMFYNCPALETIFVSEKFVITALESTDDIFLNCENLKGANEYQSGQDGIEYANYQTGYFTKYIGTLGEEIIGAAGKTLEADNLDLTGDKDFAITESFVAKTATYDRNTTATWGTLCLPFEVTLTDKNFRAFTLLSATADVVELKEVETSIAAGTPVIIKMSDNATNLNIVETGKEIKTAAMVGSSTSDGNYKLVGLYTKKMFDETDNNCFILKNDKLMNPAKILLETTTKAVGTKAFRAYMEGNSSESGAKIFSLDISDSTTAIDNLNALADSKAEYYNMQGHRLNNLQKGINIVKRNGKTMKVIIK